MSQQTPHFSRPGEPCICMKRRLSSRGFTLVEMLVVMAIMSIMTSVLLLSFFGLGNSGNLNSATYQVKGILEDARSYAMANNTYVWVGFFEENGSQSSANPANAGTGRLVISVVASADGTQIYDLANPSSTPLINSQSLVQISPLMKISNIHLKTAIAGDTIFPIGSGIGSTFPTRPGISGTNAQIGDTSPTSTQPLFYYPVAGPGAATPQYTFTKAIQFNTRGEAVLDDSNNSIEPVVEIGLQSANGSLANTTSLNVAAVQITGIAGNVNIYRR